MLQELTAEIEKTAKAVVNEIHTALPGEVVSFDGETATVKPLGEYVTSDGVSLSYPLITEAPVCFPCSQSSGIGIAFPIKKGDSCIIIVSEVELDAWRTGADSEGSLRFDLTSAIVIPGLLNGICDIATKALKEDAIVIAGGDVELVMSEKECKINAGKTTFSVLESGVNVDGNLTVTGDIKSNDAAQNTIP